MSGGKDRSRSGEKKEERGRERTRTSAQVHIHRGALAASVPNAQLAVVVVPPALDSAAGPHRARVTIAQGYGGGAGGVAWLGAAGER